MAPRSSKKPTKAQVDAKKKAAEAVRRAVKKVKPVAKRAGSKRTAWRAGYIAALAISGRKGDAAKAADTTLWNVWNARRTDQEFAAAEQEALEIATQLMEDEATRRAVEGDIKLKFNARTGKPYIDPRTGQPYEERVYSDTLLLARLKAELPDKYRDRSEIQHTGQDSGPIVFASRAERLKALREAQEAIADQK